MRRGDGPPACEDKICHCKKLSSPSLKGTTTYSRSRKLKLDCGIVRTLAPGTKVKSQSSPVTKLSASLSGALTLRSDHRPGSLTGSVSSIVRFHPEDRLRRIILSA